MPRNTFNILIIRDIIISSWLAQKVRNSKFNSWSKQNINNQKLLSEIFKVVFKLNKWKLNLWLTAPKGATPVN